MALLPTPFTTQSAICCQYSMSLLASASNFQSAPMIYPQPSWWGPALFNTPLWGIENVTILNSGSNFWLDDICTDTNGYNSQIQINALTPYSGSVMGFRFLQMPFLSVSGPSGPSQLYYTCPRANGNNLTLNIITGSSFDPTNNAVTPIEFISYIQDEGTSFNLQILDGGQGYAFSQSLYLPQVSQDQGHIMVTGTGSIGNITSISQGTKFYPYVIQGDSNYMIPSASANGSGAIFKRQYYQTPNQPNGLPFVGGWLLELNRLRNNMGIYLSNLNIFEPFSTCISGPWPISYPDNTTTNYGATVFYFTSSVGGTDGMITMTNRGNELEGKYSTQTRLFQNQNISSPFLQTQGLFKTIQFDFLLGSSSYVGGYLQYSCEYVPNQQNANPQTLINYSTPGGSNAFPGSLTVTTYSGSANAVTYQWNVTPQTIAAGKYSALFTITNPPNDTTSYTYTVAGGNIGYNDDILLDISHFSSSVVIKGAVLTPGICDSLPVYAIHIPNINGVGPVINNGEYFLSSSNAGTGASPNWQASTNYYDNGSWVVDSNGNIQVCSNSGQSGATPPIWATGSGMATADGTCYWNNSGPFNYPWPFDQIPYNQPNFYNEQWNVQGVTFTNAPAGLWTSFTQPVSQLNYLTVPQMPWNYTLGKTLANGNTVVQFNPMLNYDPNNSALTQNSFNQTQSVEFQLVPPAWISGSYWTSSYSIIDNNSCLHYVSQSGYGGGTMPAFTASLNAITTDGNAKWVCYSVPSFFISGSHITTSWQPNHYYPLSASITDEIGWKWTNVAFNNSQSLGATSSMVNPFLKYSGSGNNYYRPNQVQDTTGSYITLSQSYYLANLFSGSCPNNWQLTTSQSVSNLYVPHPKNMNQLEMPSYPYYWQSESSSYLIPPLSGSTGYTPTKWGCPWQYNNHSYTTIDNGITYDGGWQYNNDAYGYFIYSVSLARIGSNFDNKTLLPTLNGASGSIAEIPVTLGCIRNGSFTSFGTYNTGQTYSGLLWPIFNTSPLVYQCSERVDVKVIAIAPPATGYTIGNGWPWLAAYMNDTAQLINLLEG